MSTVRIASFDIGKKNFAFCIEEFDTNILTNLKKVHPDHRYNEDGTPSKIFLPILEQICNTGKIILHKNVDLTENCDPKKKLDPESFFNMINILDSYSDNWVQCDAFIIEEQMSFGKKFNRMAMKLGQHCYSYFAVKFGKEKNITEFPAYHKTQVLGAPQTRGKLLKKSGKYKWKTMSKPQRKKWSIKKATEILKNRGEESILKNLRTVKKKDDLADVLTQLQAYKVLTYCSC